MTDARFPERWLNDRRVLRLPDDAFRLFVMSLAWSVANQTDGRVYDDDLALIPASASGSGQLAKAGLWERVADYWLITVFEETQTTRDDLQVLANARRRKRDQMRRRRAAEAETEAASTVPGDVPGHSSGDSTRTGQAKARAEQPPTDLHAREALACEQCGSPISALRYAQAGPLCTRCEP
jgi:hypothetical protein